MRVSLLVLFLVSTLFCATYVSDSTETTKQRKNAGASVIALSDPATGLLKVKIDTANYVVPDSFKCTGFWSTKKGTVKIKLTRSDTISVIIDSMGFRPWAIKTIYATGTDTALYNKITLQGIVSGN